MKKLKDFEHKVNFGKVNISDLSFQREIGSNYRIKSFPAIKFFKKEFPYTYDGGKNAD